MVFELHIVHIEELSGSERFFRAMQAISIIDVSAERMSKLPFLRALVEPARLLDSRSHLWILF